MDLSRVIANNIYSICGTPSLERRYPAFWNGGFTAQEYSLYYSAHQFFASFYHVASLLFVQLAVASFRILIIEHMFIRFKNYFLQKEKAAFIAALYYLKRYFPFPCPVTGIITLLSSNCFINLDAPEDFSPVIFSTMVLPK